MSLPRIADHDEWLVARTKLLEKEKAMTRARDELSAARRRLPMVEITKDYRFEGPDGECGLIDLFEGRRQLILGHFMFHPEWEDGCPSCSAGAGPRTRCAPSAAARRATAPPHRRSRPERGSSPSCPCRASPRSRSRPRPASRRRSRRTRRARSGPLPPSGEGTPGDEFRFPLRSVSPEQRKETG